MTTPHALIIDDHVSNLEVLASLLELQGISHTAIKDPTKTSEALKTLPRVDLVLCDLEMPRMDGYELLKILRGQLGPAIPIIACTVHLREINTTRDLGFDGFIGKPLDADKFPEQIKRILEGLPVWEMP